jgi:putative acetyltransferase
MIRPARANDHDTITRVVEAAFGQPDEARLVQRLRAAGDVLFELVAERDGEVAGHILFSRLWADRAELYAALAPLAVTPSVQNDGLGSALVRRGLEAAKEFGAHGVIVLGHPAYYPRFGFSREAAKSIASPYSASPAFLAAELEPDAFDTPLTIAYPDAFSA